MKHSTITIIDAACGAGKSYALHRAINNLALRHTDIIVVVPSIKLIEQYQIDLAALAPTMKINTIHSENVMDDEKPIISILNYLRQEHFGKVLFITQNAFKIVCKMSSKRMRHVILDDIPPPFSRLKYDDKDGLRRILECINVITGDTDPLFYGIEVTDQVKLRKISTERDDDGNTTDLQKLAFQLLSKHDVNVRQSQDVKQWSLKLY